MSGVDLEETLVDFETVEAGDIFADYRPECALRICTRKKSRFRSVSPRFPPSPIPLHIANLVSQCIYSLPSSVKPTSNAVAWDFPPSCFQTNQTQYPIPGILQYHPSRILLRQPHYRIRKQTGLQRGRQGLRNLHNGWLQVGHTCPPTNRIRKTFTWVSSYSRSPVEMWNDADF